jgi:trehalose-6-phosphate synthase
MNLVAKEFVAARSDERGVLLLSQFTGAARELTPALIVNPYDLDEASAAMARALGDGRRRATAAMRALVAEFNVYRWAGKVVVDAARLRRREGDRRRRGDDRDKAAGRWSVAGWGGRGSPPVTGQLPTPYPSRLVIER